MQYTIENISEDSFYVNLLLGLPKLLSKLKKYGIKGYLIRRFPQQTESNIHLWENRTRVLLPGDMKKFYLSTNGFLFEWNLNFGHGDYDIIAGISINSLQDLVQVESVRNVEVLKNGTVYKPNLGRDIRIFALGNVGSRAQVVAVFEKYKFSGNIWLRMNDGRFAFLASDFSTYFKMCIAHLGVPYWQFVYTSQPVPQWVTCLISLLLPHVKDKNYEDVKTKMDFVNKLNVNVFKEDYVGAAERKVARKKIEEKKIAVAPKMKRVVK